MAEPDGTEATYDVHPGDRVPNSPSTIVTHIMPPRRGIELPLGELWRYRELAYFFVWRQVKVRYKQTIIGVAWAILQPVLTMLVFTLFFGKLARLPSDGLPYPVFFIAGLVVWTYLANSINAATNVMVEQQRVITRVYFPRLVLPLASVLSGILDLALASIVMIGLAYGYGLRPTFTLLALLPLSGLAVLLALAVGLWTSALNAMYRDAKYAVPLLIQIWLFASPVAYATSLVPTEWLWLYRVNPTVTIIEGFRWAATGAGTPPSLAGISTALTVTALLAIGGFVYFTRSEPTIVDVV